MTDIEWQYRPDPDEPTIFWVRWRAKVGTNKWHATIDGQRTLCHISIWRRLYSGRGFDRCSRCVKAARHINDPE